jgi:hypothetical protein
VRADYQNIKNRWTATWQTQLKTSWFYIMKDQARLHYSTGYPEASETTGFDLPQAVHQD